MKSSQGGATLFVVLIVLLLITLLALSTLRTGMLEEHMASNLRDRNLAFENAESALREAEHVVGAGTLGQGGALGLDCSEQGASGSSQCFSVPLGSFDREGNGWTNAIDQQPTNVSAGAPQYLIQYMGRRTSEGALGLGDDPNYGISNGRVEAEFMRVTARGVDPTTAQADDRATVVLQSTIVKE